jgi:MFS family permease
VGEIYPGETRSDAFSLIFAVPPIITVFASPAIAYLGDWRVAFLLFALPIALLSLLLIKSKIPEVASKTKGVSLYSAFRSISGNGSALTCLVSDLLNSFTWQIVGVLSISFLREYHYLPRELTSLIYSGFALAVFLGALLGGKVVKSIGRKKSVVVLYIIFGVSALLFVLVPGAYLSATFGTLACFISGLSQPAASSYEIDQIPELRGSIMSLSSAFGNLGGTIGAVIAGFLLLVFGWVIAGVSLGIAAIIGGMILQFFSSEPKEQD